MPVVTIRAQAEWFPPDTSFEVSSIGSGYTDKHRAVFELAQQLPLQVSEILNQHAQPEADATPYSRNVVMSLTDLEVVVVFEQLHAKCINVPSLWIILSPMRNMILEANQDLILRDLREFVAAFFTDRLIAKQRPDVELEVIFLRGVGAALNGNGSAGATW